MPKKSKKQKLSHQNTSSDAPLSHNEVWDDSALINSWNAAVSEYEYYHSLAAKGLDVEDVLDQAEEAEENGGEVDLMMGESGEAVGQVAEESIERHVEEGEVEDGEVEEEAPMVKDNAKMNVEAPLIGPQLPNGVSPEQPAAVEGTTVTSAPVADQTLENIKMAYYWAGYYSGLYDGQRQVAGGQEQSKGAPKWWLKDESDGNKAPRVTRLGRSHCKSNETARRRLL